MKGYPTTTKQQQQLVDNKWTEEDLGRDIACLGPFYQSQSGIVTY